MPKNLNAIIQKKLKNPVIIKARNPKAVSKNLHILPGSNPKQPLALKTQACFCMDTRKTGKAEVSDTSAAIYSSDLYFLRNFL